MQMAAFKVSVVILLTVSCSSNPVCIISLNHVAQNRISKTVGRGGDHRVLLFSLYFLVQGMEHRASCISACAPPLSYTHPQVLDSEHLDP
jgi:hypothetical protein